MNSGIDKTVDEALKEVKQQLQIAIELEHATIPPYLYAFWSIKNHEDEVAHVLFEVIKEEMLHMSLACNILNSIGGNPCLNYKAFIPDYPTALPAHDMLHDPFIVSLRKLDIKAIVTFLHIELPEELGIPRDDDDEVGTIGEFYDKIIDNLKLLPDEFFSNRRQVQSSFAPHMSGELFEICSKEDAFRAIELIIEQGEGMSVETHPGEEPAHFERFLDVYTKMGGTGVIERGKFRQSHMIRSVKDDVYRLFQRDIRNVVANPRENNRREKTVDHYGRKFNSLYSRMLDKLQEAFNSHNPDLMPAIELMFLMTRPAHIMMSIPVDPDDLSKGYCGPTFEYLTVEERA